MGPGLLNQDSMCLRRVPEWENWRGPWHESEGHRQAGGQAPDTPGNGTGLSVELFRHPSQVLGATAKCVQCPALNPF